MRYAPIIVLPLENCGKRNHFGKCCRSQTQKPHNGTEHIPDEHFYVAMVESSRSNERDWNTFMDTGVQVNILQQHEYRKFKVAIQENWLFRNKYNSEERMHYQLPV